MLKGPRSSILKKFVGALFPPQEWILKKFPSGHPDGFQMPSLIAFVRCRVIQLNMEISLIMAHICLLLPALYDYPWPCRVVSIFIHFFFTSAFMFMFLESLHVYAQVSRTFPSQPLLLKVT